MELEVQEALTSIMGSDIDEEIINYIVHIRQEEDLDEFLSNVVDSGNPEHQKAVEKLKLTLIGKPKEKKVNVQFSKENEGNSNKTKGHKGKKLDNEPKNKNVDESTSKSNTSAPQTSKSKKKNFIPFDTFSNRPALKEGRHPCNCEARIHKLISNCLDCGKIVCEQEGSGPCLFCGNMVATREEMETLNANTKESKKLYNKLVDQKKSKEWKEAIKTRDKMVTADRNKDMNNTIYDDQNDYFCDYNERNTSKSQVKMTLDLATKTFTLDEEKVFEKHKEAMMKDVNKLLDINEQKRTLARKFMAEDGKEELYNELAKMMETKCGPSSVLDQNSDKKHDKKSKTPVFNRVVNEEMMANVDKGMCLSMHQPWASLLVAGIKKHEGRAWHTDHRGRLWIHAASKEPVDNEIIACEEIYRQLYKDKSLQFPRKYPTGCLLGAVFVENCLPQKEYREKYPDGESESPYVLICSNPLILPVFFPMSGQHKIFKMDKEMHRTAKQALLASTWT